MDEDGYYTYDSAKSGAAYNQSEGRFYVYEDGHNSFFPYNYHTETMSSSNGYIDYWFGVFMEVDMYLPSATNSGTEGNPVNQVNGNDMVFDFSGDDDIMIFIDDKMVVDMSGIHSTSYSRINFSTNTVSYSMGLDENGAPDTTGAGGKFSIDNNLNLSAGGHTMQIFYMERGASASNLKIQFNVAPAWEYETGSVQTVTAEKVWENSDGTKITDTENVPAVEVGLFDALGPETDDTFGYTQNGTKYTVAYTDDEGIARTYVYDTNGPTLTYTEGAEGTVTETDDKTNSKDQVIDKDGYVVAWLDEETLHIRIDRQTLSEDNGWTYAWELLDADGSYEALELSEDSSYTTTSASPDLDYYPYWSVIGDAELEEMLGSDSGEIGPIILTEAAQEAESTLGDTKEAKGYVIVATTDGVHTEQVDFSQIATMSSYVEGQTTIWYGVYGVTSQSEIDALGEGALWYPEYSGNTHRDSNGNEIKGFYLYCQLGSETYYLMLNRAEDGLTLTTEKDQASEFFYDVLGEFMVSTEVEGVDNAVRVEIDSEGNIHIDEAEWEAALDDVRIYTLSATQTGGFAFTATNTLLYEFRLNKVENSSEAAILDGAKFSLYKDAGCKENIGFIVSEVIDNDDEEAAAEDTQIPDEDTDAEVTGDEDTVRTVYTVSDDTGAENYTTTITAGSVTIAGIAPGTYYLKEETSPYNDYIHLNEVIVIMITADGYGTATVTVGELPNHVTSDGDTITVENHARGSTIVPVQKVWDDKDDQDGVRPGSITFHLFADGVEVDSATVTAEDGWAYTFTNLPIYQSEDDGEDNDVKIVYTVTEDPIVEANGDPIYETKIEETGEETSDDYTGYTVKNSYTPAETEVTVTKKWDDGEAIQLPPDSVEVQLYADGTVSGDPVTLSEENEWTYTWTKLPAYSAGTVIEYTVKEADVTGYTPSYGEVTGSVEEGYAVTITNTPNPVELSIQKTVAGTADTTEYEFRITLKSGDTAYNGDIAVTYSDGTTETDDTLTFKDGVADVTIGAGDTITLTLVYGMSWEVTELTEGADSTVIYVNNEIVDAASGTIEEDTPVRFVNSYRGYFPIDEEIVPDYTDRTTWVKEEAVNEYNAIEIEMSTLLPVITGYDLENGSFTMNFHEILDHELILDEADADFMVFIGGEQIPHDYYTVTLASGANPTALRPYNVSPADDGCSFHVDVDLTALYVDGLITEEYLQGDTEIIIFFFADLEGTDLNGTYKSTVWYDVYDGENWEYTSNVDVVDVYTYEISIMKYDASTLEDDDYDGSALAGATLGVYYDPECIDPVSRNGEPYTVTSAYDGRAVFYGLADGTYYVKETEPPVGYVLSDKVLAVELGEDLNDTGYMYSGIFANTPETTDVSGSKIWDDADDQDGVRPESITVNLLADGEKIDSVTVTAGDGWEWSFTDLPKYRNGVEIVYTVTEDTVGEYTTVIDGYDITNSYTPGKVGLNVQKIWDDSDDQDGIRPESIAVELLKNGKKTGETLTLDASNDWAGSFTDLDEYTDGELNEYTVAEVSADGYDSVVTQDEGTTSYIIINTHTPETTEVSGTKTWDDDADRDGIRPASVNIILLADGEPAGSVTVTEADGWAWNFTDLPVYKNGTEIVYSFTEEAVEGYEADYDGYDVINTHIPEVTEVSGSKIWDDADDQDGKRPESITVNLLADGEKTDSVTVTAADDWAWNFTDLPKYRDGGVEIVYTVTEDAVVDYTTVIDGYDITNSYTPGKTGLNVQKVWDDGDDQDAIRPESVTVELLRNGEKTGDTLTLDESNGWSGSFTDLDEYTGGVKNEYTAEEVPVDGYDTNVTDDGDAVVSIIKNTHTPETTEVSGSKTWDDMNDQDGKRPESITISLLADGEPAGSVTVTAKDDWSWNFTDLPKYRNGEEIVYSIAEEEVPEYSTSYDGYDVINHYIPATVDVPVEKKWDDDNNAEGARPSSVVVELLKNGESTGRALILGEDNGWSGSFANLDEYTAGTKNVYTVRELDVEGYTAEITGDAETGYVITNTYSPDNGNPDTGNPDTGNPDNGSPDTQTGPGPVVENPSTGGTTGAKTADTNAPILYMLLIAAAGAVIVTLGVRRRRQVF